MVQNDETEGLGLNKRYLKDSLVSYTVFIINNCIQTVRLGIRNGPSVP